MTIYALLIAIDDYHPETNVPRLLGCANDVHSVHEYLKTQFSEDQRKVVTLINEQATYENVIDHFGPKHLSHATEGDKVLIHFSGHGARGLSAPEFKAYFPDGMDENLVLYDSRLPEKYDLADKELAVLIERLVNKKADVIVLLDCCHSGSGTRSSADDSIAESRQWEDREKVRPLETYLDGHFEQNLYVPNSRHILLAACEKRQKAFELSNNSGVFTSNLLKVLDAKNGEISYADLFTETRIRMRSISKGQTPQFEPYGYFNIHQFFLKSEENSVQSYPLLYENEKWKIQAGALQGLGTSPDEKSFFAIMDGNKAIGKAKTTIVELESCFVEVDVELDTSNSYQTKLLSIPKPPIAVELITVVGSDRKAGLNRELVEQEILHKALERHKPIYFEFTEENPLALFEMKIDRGLQLIRKEDQKILHKAPDMDLPTFRIFFELLEHICQWEKTRLLGKGNIATNDNVKILLQLLDENGEEISEITEATADIQLPQRDGIPQKVKYRIVAHNTSQRPKQVTLLHFNQKYGVRIVYNEEIPKESKALVMEKNEKGYAHSFSLKKVSKATEYFKLIVSNKKINSAMLFLEDLDLEIGRSSVKRKSKRGSALENWYAVDMKCSLI